MLLQLYMDNTMSLFVDSIPRNLVVDYGIRVETRRYFATYEYTRQLVQLREVNTPIPLQSRAPRNEFEALIYHRRLSGQSEIQCTLPTPLVKFQDLALVCDHCTCSET